MCKAAAADLLRLTVEGSVLRCLAHGEIRAGRTLIIGDAEEWFSRWTAPNPEA